MKQLLRFILIGILTMFAMEFQINVLGHGRLDHFAMAVGFYVFLLTLFFFIGQSLDRKISPKHVDVIYSLIGGLFGLLVVEWLFMRNYPGSGKGAIQTAMFALWAAVFTLPRLFAIKSDSEIRPLRMRTLATVLVYSVLATAAVFITPQALKLPVQAILMSAYGLILNFMLVPFLCRNGFSKNRLYAFVSILAFAGAANVLFFW